MNVLRLFEAHNSKTVVTKKMAMNRRTNLVCLACILLVASFSSKLARAQSTWPERPVRIVVNGVVGGSADVSARIIGDALTTALGKPFIVDVRAGGSGTIGTQEVLRSAPDGHTLLVSVNSAMSEVPHSVKMTFDPLKDIRPIAELWHGSLILVGNNNVPANTLPELLAWIKRQPKGVSYASYSPGTASHLMGVLLARDAGIELNHVGYRGAPPAMTDLVAGQIPLMFNGISVSLQQLKAGKIKAFAVAGADRSEFLPEVPTFAELGFPDIDTTTSMAVWVSSKVPQTIQDRLRAELDKVLAKPDVIERFKTMGTSRSSGASQEALSQALVKQYRQTGAILQSIGYKPE